jgi:hypothetical protein
VSEFTYSLVRAAEVLSEGRKVPLSRRALKGGIDAERVECTKSGTGNGTRYGLTEAQLEAARALRCLASGCEEVAPTESRCCSPACFGKAGLGEGESSATAAAKRAGMATQTLTRKIERGEVPARQIAGPSGPTYALTDGMVQELCRAAAAPKQSGKVIQTCEHCGEPFMTTRSNVERGRGRYGSQRCNKLAQREADPENHPNPEAVRAGVAGREQRIAREQKSRDDGVLSTVATQARLRSHGILASIQTITGTTGYYGRGLLPGQVERINGSRRLGFPEDGIDEFAADWLAGGDGRRAIALDPRFLASRHRSRFGDNRLYGKYAKEIAATEGKKVGPKFQLDETQRERIRSFSSAGLSVRGIVDHMKGKYKDEVSKSQVHRFLASEKVSRYPT